jgi:hypothetical protein
VIAPGGQEGFFEGAFGGFGEKHARRALAAPGSVDGRESDGIGLDEVFLLRGRELDHATFFVWVAEGGEDFPGDAEVGMVHVATLFGLGKRESEAAKVLRCGWQGGAR